MKGSLIVPVLKGIRNRVNAIRLIRVKPNVMNSCETVNYILEKNCSVARYGDGEYAIMSKRYDLFFQPRSDRLSEALYDVMKNPPDGLLVCVPDVFGSLKKFNHHSRTYWSNWRRIDFAKMIRHMQGKRYLFGDAMFLRTYIAYPDDRNARELFPLIRKIWEKRDVLIVEGEQTRFGVNNDLLDNAGSVERILAPAINAFSRYDEILTEVRAHAEGKLILLALGPTATVMACDLCRQGYRAIDIGHLDIEYEWYLAKAKEKTAIPGKYINEVREGRVFTECGDSKYKSQIMKVIT